MLRPLSNRNQNPLSDYSSNFIYITPLYKLLIIRLNLSVECLVMKSASNKIRISGINLDIWLHHESAIKVQKKSATQYFILFYKTSPSNF